MDIGAVRAELAVGIAAGLVEQGVTDPAWFAYGTVPEDTAVLPAFVVGVPEQVTYARTFSTGTGLIRLPVTAIVDLGSDWEQAQNRLDAAMSSDTAGSFYDGLRWWSLFHEPTSFKAVRYVEAGNYRRVQLGETPALAADLVLEISV